jgi:hypothetical protein
MRGSELPGEEKHKGEERRGEERSGGERRGGTRRGERWQSQVGCRYDTASCGQPYICSSVFTV